MAWSTMRGLGVRWLALLLGLIGALGGCGQLSSQQAPVPLSQQQQASIKLPPL
jgi:hypothetical protein